MFLVTSTSPADHHPAFSSADDALKSLVTTSEYCAYNGIPSTGVYTCVTIVCFVETIIHKINEHSKWEIFIYVKGRHMNL